MKFFLLALLMITSSLFAQSPVTVEIESLPIKKTQRFAKKPRPTVLMVDDFEDGDMVQFRDWWQFGNVSATPFRHPRPSQSYVQSTSLAISGTSTDWYAGGVGVYLNKDISSFTVLKMVIFSKDAMAGAIRIELYDDDNNNAIVDLQNNVPSKDDIYAYYVPLLWEGWNIVTIPITSFSDINPTVGDNQWNPNHAYGSSGLTQLQLVVLSSKYPSESIECWIDTIKFN